MFSSLLIISSILWNFGEYVIKFSPKSTFCPKFGSSLFSIIKLESSIEIKAVSKENAYSKLIPINLPITNFNFSNEKLILEMNQIQN